MTLSEGIARARTLDLIDGMTSDIATRQRHGEEKINKPEA
jgi:hypothetical protein